MHDCLSLIVRGRRFDAAPTPGNDLTGILVGITRNEDTPFRDLSESWKLKVFSRIQLRQKKTLPFCGLSLMHPWTPLSSGIIPILSDY